MSSSMVNVVTILVVAALRRARRHADLLDERLGGRLHRRPRRRVRVDGPKRGAVLFPPRAGKRARRLSVRPQAVRDDAAVGDGSVAARHPAWGRVRRRLVRDPEGRLQPHARPRPGQRPARRGVGGRGGGYGLSYEPPPSELKPRAGDHPAGGAPSNITASTLDRRGDDVGSGAGRPSAWERLTRRRGGALPSAPAPAPSTRRSEHTRTLSERSVAARPSSSAAVAQAG